MEVRFTDTMVFQQPFFCKGPEAFQSINMFSAFTKFFTMINGMMFTKKLKRFIRFKLVGVKHTSFFCVTFNLAHQCFSRNIIHNNCKNSTLLLKHSKYLYFISRTTSSGTLFLPTKIAFITFNFTRQLSELIAQIIKYFQAVIHIMIANHIVTIPKVSCCFSCGNLQAEIVKKFEFFCNLSRTVFIQTTTAFVPLIAKRVELSTPTFWAVFSFNDIFNYFQHYQVNLTLGPKNG